MEISKERIEELKEMIDKVPDLPIFSKADLLEIAIKRESAGFAPTILGGTEEVQ